jgi:putative heme-binding domain-containing protein
LSDVDRAENQQTLVTLLAPQTPTELQSLAIEALEGFADPGLAARLLDVWDRASPQVGVQLVDVLLRRPAWCNALLEAMEQGRIPRSALTTAQIDELRQIQDADLQVRAEKLWPVSSGGTPELRPYADYDLAQGDFQRGRQIFERNCAACHRAGDLGQTLGPDVMPFASKPFAALLVAVLIPNDAVDPRYINYQVTLDDGRVASGIVLQETDTTLVLADGKRAPETISRSKIEQLRRTGLSLMPSGFAQDITPAAMADLYAFLQHAASSQ